MTHPGVHRAFTLPVTPKGQENGKNNYIKHKYWGRWCRPCDAPIGKSWTGSRAPRQWWWCSRCWARKTTQRRLFQHLRMETEQHFSKIREKASSQLSRSRALGSEHNAAVSVCSAERCIMLRVLSDLKEILYTGSSYLSSWAWASTLRGLPLMWTVPETFPGKREVSQQTPGSRNTGSGKPLNTVENIIWIENRSRKTLVTMSHCSPLAFNEKCNLAVLFKIMQGTQEVIMCCWGH